MARRELCLIVIVLAMVAMAMLVAILILKWTDHSNDTGIWKDQASNETEAIGKHSDHSGDFAGPSALDRSRIGFPAFDKIRWDEFDLLNKIGLQSQQVADASYIESGLATPEKQESRDALAKTVYSKLFDWLVEKINKSIGQDPDSQLLIGVLDIYGFESFRTNRCLAVSNSFALI
ncbi:unnamed protein product [Cuscuta campestris]|uniref:Myosin motor domain-containing protein n=1 Tax=Cuscuta campestris TaxID=132261 RepID=A0A484LHZ9_9ASTE|nr:unnamed protein product [Cuscuta campestris]